MLTEILSKLQVQPNQTLYWSVEPLKDYESEFQVFVNIYAYQICLLVHKSISGAAPEYLHWRCICSEARTPLLVDCNLPL